MSKLLSLLEIVGQAQLETGMAQVKPATVFNSEDQDVVQMGALMHALADEVLLEEPYKTTLGDGIWATTKDGAPRPNGPEADSDIILFDPRLAITGLKFHFLSAKGLEFGEAMRNFVNRQNRLAADFNGRVLDLDVEDDREI